VKSNIQLKHSNYVAFSHFHGCAVNNSGLALVDTPGFFASVIRRVIGIDYIHVVLSMDEELNEAYSVGRRNPAVPILAGFEKEDAQKNRAGFPYSKI